MKNTRIILVGMSIRTTTKCRLASNVHKKLKLAINTFIGCIINNTRSLHLGTS